MSLSDRVPLPPPDAKVLTTACDYCIVGCGYKAYVWPEGVEGGPKASENAFGVDYPTSPLSGKWTSPNQHNVVEIGGRRHNVVVIAAADAKVVNLGGDHSMRGGTLARKLYSPNTPTRDRLARPFLRTGDGGEVPLSWEDALDMVAGISSHVLQNHGEMAWAMKTYSYQYYENTYAITKLALGAVKTPCFAPHDKPSTGDDTPGVSDAGINVFSAAYQDWKDADVVLVSGANLSETKTILYSQWIAAGGAKLIMVDPRKTFTAAHAEKRGGLHLQLVPGTDTVLNNAIAREIVERGWEDSEFILSRVATAADLALETSWRRRMFGVTFEDYKTFLLADDVYRPDNAAAVTGVPAEKISKAASMMAEPVGGARPKTSVLLEKGNYWTHNYENTASLASLGLLVGAGGRPGQMISRGGGHQRGMLSAASYPLAKSTDEYMGNKIELNLDRWLAQGKVRFAWAIGTTWLAAMGASQHLASQVLKLVRGTAPQITYADAYDKVEVLRLLKQRVDNGGMVLVHQDIYRNALTGFADIVLPAATWGEEDFSRMQGERRLRLYSKIMDAPGEAKPDWWIVAHVAKRMGYQGFDWKDGNEVFEEGSQNSAGKTEDFAELVGLAKEGGMRGHELLRSLGTTGIQCPIKREGGALVGTVRLHQEKFNTKSGKAVFVKGNWTAVKPFQDMFAPAGDELWVINMRTNELWQSGFDDARIAFRHERFPEAILEVNPQDAAARGIESGDWVLVSNDAVLTSTGGTHAGRFKAIAYVSDIVPPGVTSSYFLANQGALDTAGNSVVPGLADPINNRYRYKLGKGRLTRLGSSEFKGTMSFVPRNLA